MPFSIYLASGSPRRKELLSQIGVRHEQLLPLVDESKDENESPTPYVKRLARLKAEAGLKMLAATEQRPVLGADTIVVLDDNVYGKPGDADEAFSTLMALSGRTHQVMTAVAVVSQTSQKVICSCSNVRFRTIQPDEARAYCQSGEPMDKAGAYAIQGVGAIFVEEIQGSYSGIVGLPLMDTAKLLSEFGVSVLV